MDSLKVCFVGVGSIAKRHIKKLRVVCDERNIKLEISALRRKAEPVNGVDTIYSDEKELPSYFDVIFITNPTELHLATLERFHDKGKYFFIEKPVVSLSQISKGNLFQIRDNAVYYVACPLRYNAVIQYIKKNINPSDVISVRSISSSYLPDWRPGQDYRDTYSAHKHMGGGVSVDLIHEWDYLTYLFGWPHNIKCFIGKKSNLDIDCEDYAIYIADYNDKVVELHLDYFGRRTLREIQLFTKEDTILGDIANSKISFLKSGKTIDFDENRDDFQKRELEYFLDLIVGDEPLEDGYHHGLRVLDLTQGKV